MRVKNTVAVTKKWRFNIFVCTVYLFPIKYSTGGKLVLV